MKKSSNNDNDSWNDDNDGDDGNFDDNDEKVTNEHAKIMTKKLPILVTIASWKNSKKLGMGKLCHPLRAIPKSKRLFSTDFFPMCFPLKTGMYYPSFSGLGETPLLTLTTLLK